MSDAAHNRGRYPAIFALAAVALIGFALGEVVLRTRYDSGVSGADLVRATWGGLVLAMSGVGLSAIVDVLATRLEGVAWRVVSGTALLAPLASGVALAGLEPGLAFGDLLPAAVGAAVGAYLFWKAGLFDTSQPGIVGPIALLLGSTALLLPAQYGPDRWVLNGLPVARLSLALMPATVGIGAFIVADLRERGRFHHLFVGLVAATCLVSIAVLPFVFPGVVFFLKLNAAAFALAGTTTVLAVLAPPLPSSGRRACIALLGALFIATGGWSLSQSVSDRFGPLGYDSVAGLGAALVSTPDDADGDGFYASGVPIPDCDDADETKFPGAPGRACITFEPLGANPATERYPEPRHVIVVMSDALRARDIYDPEKMPTVSRSGPGVVHFRRAYSPGNTTRLSARPIWTAVSPTRYVLEPGIEPRADAWWFGDLPQDFTARWIVASDFAWMHDPSQWTGNPEIDRYIYETDEDGRSIDLAVDDALAALDAAGEGRAAIGLFSTDPHADYRCDDGTVGERRCYDDEIRALDRAMARLFSELEARGVRDETLVALTSDHGEEFGEHGHFGQHASTLFEEQIHVPLTFWYPQLPEREVNEPVSVLALTPTLADLAGTPLAFRRSEGSLVPLIRAQSASVRSPLVHHWTGLVLGVGVRRTTIIERRLKLEYDWRTGHVRLADLTTDPAETRNFAAQRPDDTARLLRELHQRQTHAMSLSNLAFDDR